MNAGRDWTTAIEFAREYVAQCEYTPTFPDLFAVLVERGLCRQDDNRRFRLAVSNAMRRGKLPRLASSYRDWPPVLDEARRIVARHPGMPTFKQLAAELIEDGLLEEHQLAAFRGALSGAQRKGEFPSLTPGSRSVAHTRTAHQVHQEHRTRCVQHLTRMLRHQSRIELNPQAMRSLADEGFGAHTVAWALGAIREHGVGRVERSGGVVVVTELADDRELIAA